jgi:RimJ/RimL family protein N-acetyltransferase
METRHPALSPVIPSWPLPVHACGALVPDDRVRLVEILARHPCASATIDEPHDLNVERARRWIDSRVAEEKMGYALHWAICPLSDDELIGYVGLHDIDLERGHAELCFWLELIPNSGDVMLEATQTALAFAFENLRMNSMRAVSTPVRAGVGELLSSIGMRRLQPICDVGSDWTRFNDVHIWTITRRRWEQRLLGILHN